MQASEYRKAKDLQEEILGHHQLRAAHQRYTAVDKKIVEYKGHGHAVSKSRIEKLMVRGNLPGFD